MRVMSGAERAEPPVFFQARHTDEYAPPEPTAEEQRAAQRVRDAAADNAEHVGTPLRTYWRSRLGTAQGLRALNTECGDEFYVIPREAELDGDAADDALGGDQLVIDVQTHFVADAGLSTWQRLLMPMYRALMPEWWSGFDGLESYSMAEYLRCVYVESETALAILTSAPDGEDRQMLPNPQMAATREMFDRLGANGRLLNHTVVRPEIAGDIEAMASMRDRYRPAAWKVYTMGTQAGGTQAGGTQAGPGVDARRGWWLDDEEIGHRFLEHARDLGVRRVCAHKGMSALVDTGSPRDVGPAARAFPDIDFIIYHSGYESPMRRSDPTEGAYTAATAHLGVNRLITSLREAGVGAGENVYAELGTTWFCVLRRPVEAAHVLGKLLLAFGEDNVLWGTDGIWYGPTQPLLDSFRAFQIPERMREEFGYPELTSTIREKILGANAARVYEIDTHALRSRVAEDELAWVKAAVDEYHRGGVPGA